MSCKKLFCGHQYKSIYIERCMFGYGEGKVIDVLHLHIIDVAFPN